MHQTQLEHILEILEANPEGLCDACVRRFTGIGRHQTVNQNCRRAENLGLLTRQRETCSHCQKRRETNKLQAIHITGLTATPGLQRQQVSTSATPDWFERLRHKLVQKLNELDGTSRGQAFSRRVTNLRNEGRLEPNIACLMLTFTSFRNLVCFERYSLTEKENQIVRLAAEELTLWLNQSKR